MQKKLQLAFGAALLSTTCLTNASAQEAQTLKVNSSLDEVTVYATRSEANVFDVPAMVSTVNTEAAGVATSGTISQVLDQVPGVTVVGGPRRAAQIVTIRGFDSDAILTMVDDRRQNFESGHDGRIFIDPALLKSVEVVKGGASAIYGGGAVGGVVAFKTKDAADLLEPGEKMGALTSLGYRSATGEFSATQAAYGRTENLDLLASLNYRKAGDVQMGAAVHSIGSNDLPARDRLKSGLVKAGLTFGDYHTVSANIHRLDQDSEEPSTNSGVTTSSNATVDKEIDDLQLGLKYAYDNPDNNWLKPSVHVYRNRSEVFETDLTGSRIGREKMRRMTTVGFTADNQSILSVSDAHSHTLSYGVEYYTDKQDGESNSTAFGGVPNAEGQAYGVYLQDQIDVNTGAGELSIIPALRYDKYKSDDEDGNSLNEGAASPKLSLSYKPVEQLMLFGSWSKAFRAPNLTEVYADGQHWFGNNFQANPDLKPETVTTIEVGAGVDFKELLSSNDRLQVKGSMFRARGEDFIDQEITATTTKYINIDKAELKGWELEAKYGFAPFTASAGLSYVRARNKVTDKYLEASEPLTLTTGLSYDVASIDSTFGWNAKFSDQNHETATASLRKDGYAVHDIYYRYQPTNNLIVDLGIDNVFDEAYKASTTLYEEGRSFVGKVTYKW
ncbi:TonB-dependent hemoglobin/transferrin/lactoferrin family receptor [Terasakiella pusilla]|uniref:TonB-dependent hemoglobin/transferrin/lactoferrin family receptor n=1 Tax=Terasakiella pusilla TaxID=64973 RepID=UPI003AA9C494